MAIIAMFSLKILTGKGSEQKKDISSLSLEEQYKSITSSSKPSIIVFSYDADCCETTKKFFNAYNTKAKQLMKEYENKVGTLFINTGTVTEDKENEVLSKIANDNNVSILPSILILDANGDKIKVFEGTLDNKEVRKILDEVVKK
jgi:thioredoxin-related protein